MTGCYVSFIIRSICLVTAVSKDNIVVSVRHGHPLGFDFTVSITDALDALKEVGKSNLAQNSVCSLKLCSHMKTVSLPVELVVFTELN